MSSPPFSASRLRNTPSTSPIPFLAPQTVDHFTGRDAECVRLRELLVPGDQPTGTYFGLALSPVAGSVVLRLDVVEGAGP